MAGKLPDVFLCLCVPQGVGEEPGSMERGPPNMTVSLTPEYPGYGSDNSTQNSEGGSSSGSLKLYYWLDLLSLLIALFGLVGNGAVLWLLGFRIRRNPFSVYILNLAGADALFLCFFFLRSTLTLLIYDSAVTWKILSFLSYMSYTAGLSLLAAISTERCLSALFPLWYRCRRPKHTSAAVCAGIWALAGMVWPLSFFLWVHNFVVFITILGSWLLLLTCVLCVSSLTLLLRVQCRSLRRRPPNLYLLVLLTVLVFLLCGLPWGVGDFMPFYSKVGLLRVWLYDLLACVNSSVNPLIYFFVGRLGNRRREPLREVLQRALGDEQELGGGTTNTPHTSSAETTL
ncbi:mas-related G-protein coupled receptor member A-like [Sarcophilus harrisii]|uniref:mas-related G-protein coupled receptor member A-like n=1 Tax=Sarcophilus harrisii TaxID=9305 RepID=UPI001301C525|nr:mas-related G-protein coupled receptor member A-like [Sarcophilus harrisii]